MKKVIPEDLLNILTPVIRKEIEFSLRTVFKLASLIDDSEFLENTLNSLVDEYSEKFSDKDEFSENYNDEEVISSDGSYKNIGMIKKKPIIENSNTSSDIVPINIVKKKSSKDVLVSRNIAKKKNEKIKYRGVSLTPTGKYKARVSINSQDKYLGCFEDAKIAAIAYDKARYKKTGSTKKLNFPEMFKK